LNVEIGSSLLALDDFGGLIHIVHIGISSIIVQRCSTWVTPWHFFLVILFEFSVLVLMRMAMRCLSTSTATTTRIINARFRRQLFFELSEIRIRCLGEFTLLLRSLLLFSDHCRHYGCSQWCCYSHSYPVMQQQNRHPAEPSMLRRLV
jgi:hypothetical protein